MSDDLYAIIADQAETIDELTAKLKIANLLSEGEQDQYWSGVYDRIRSAWDRWALTELGTASPSPIDLAGRGELDALWQSIK